MTAGLLTTMQGLVDQSLVGLIGDDDVPFDWQLLDASEAQALT